MVRRASFVLLVLVVACGGSSEGSGATAGDGGQGGVGGSAGQGGAGGMGGTSGNAGEGGTGGSAGAGGEGGAGGGELACVDSVCSCTEVGIRAAIAEGGGPFTFDCDGPTSVLTEAEIVIDNDVILDGEGSLTVDGRGTHRVFSVPPSVTAALHGLAVTNGSVGRFYQGGGVLNQGTLTLTDCNVSWNIAGSGGGIYNVSGGALALTNSTVARNTADNGGGINNDGGAVTLSNSTVLGNTAAFGGGIENSGELTLTRSAVLLNAAAQGGGIFNVWGPLVVTNSTVSENSARLGGGIGNQGAERVTLSNSTVSSNVASSGGGIDNVFGGDLSVSGTLIDNNDCVGVTAQPGGYNIESPGDTCGFDEPTDQVNVSADDLKLEPLADNGGPTMTHALGAGSVAINVIPEAECVDADSEPLTTDQRGEPRPGGTTCDVGAFEAQP